MVGNKHKNGIICTFPNCNKPMRTQKFKMHFTRVHLRDGEVYSVDHRRQYEVAREENSRCSVKHELVSDAALPAMPLMVSLSNSNEATSCMEKSAPLSVARPLGDNTRASQAKQSTLVQSQPVRLTSQAEVSTTRGEERAGNVNPSRTLYLLPAYGNVSISNENTSGRKRSASVVQTSAETEDQTSALLMQFIALMDQRFQELVSKMGEMIDVQKDLIDTLQASNPLSQAPTSAFPHAVDAVMKRRKKDTSPHSDNDGSEHATGSSNTDTDADGAPSSGFVL
ncbi:unnamed protein product [Peronospora belbahrii]|uniref:C2H2-type domain-containing protein n=1 Tax=Peronospora belbahrii TaxID=622444 RepID=A0AAU9L5D2_9STRA|nr:unnamed protein product [Peronospora belbahrii]CAH0514905.1 unnamed protein product [Peronospora belbahrii]